MSSRDQVMTAALMRDYELYLRENERSRATIEKYGRDVRGFYEFLPEGKGVDRENVVRYKEYLQDHYAASSVNSMLAAVNGFLCFAGWTECKVKALKIQRQMFCAENKELTREEYLRLLNAAKQKKSDRLFLLLQTICSTGIRVSELACITVDAVKNRRAKVFCKGKNRIVFLPEKLCRQLLAYTEKQGITAGSIFVSKNGESLDRSNIWAEMKKLCESAGVDRSKVFPHNLRHLFARTYYNMEKDIVRLADILGHSSVDTARIYTIASGQEHEQQIAKLDLTI